MISRIALFLLSFLDLAVVIGNCPKRRGLITLDFGKVSFHVTFTFPLTS